MDYEDYASEVDEYYSECYAEPSRECISSLPLTKSTVDDVFSEWDTENGGTDKFFCLYDGWLEVAHKFVLSENLTEKEGQLL